MKIVVCVKQVPDPQSHLKVGNDSRFIDSEGLGYITSPCDLIAVKWAGGLKGGNISVQITAISLGSHSAEKVLRECIAFGADRALLLCDAAFENSDGYATGVVLAKAIELLQYDIVFCGFQALDTGAGWVGPVVAHRLGIPLVTRVAGIEVHDEERKVTVQRRLEGTNREIVETSLPCLLTVDSLLDKPRYPSVRSIQAAQRQNIEHLNKESLGLSLKEVGSSGSKTHIKRLSVSKPRPKKLFTPDSSLPAVERMRLIMSGGIIEKKDSRLEGNSAELASRLVQFLRQERILH